MQNKKARAGRIGIAVGVALVFLNQSSFAVSFPTPTLKQSWADLFYVNWPVSPEQVRKLVPAPLEIDTFEGNAYISAISFEMKEMNLTGNPFPGFPSFPELNFRTYVRQGGQRGIYLFSVDITSRLLVDLSHLLFPAPFLSAEMSLEHSASPEVIRFDSVRTDQRAPSAEFHAEFTVLEHFDAPSGTLENFVAERYNLFQADSAGCVKVATIRHDPLPLQKVTLRSFSSTLPQSIGFESGSPEAVFYAAGAQTQLWPFRDLGCKPGGMLR